MWKAAASPPAKAVAWDAHWAKQKSEHHHKVTQWNLKKLETKLGKPAKTPAMFAKL
jgi:hypothetical protein